MHDGAVEKKWRRVISVGGRTPAPPRRRRARAQNFATSGFHFIEASVIESGLGSCLGQLRERRGKCPTPPVTWRAHRLSDTAGWGEAPGWV